MGGISKAFKKVTQSVGKIFGGGGSSSRGTQEVIVQAPAANPVANPAANPTDITGQYSGSEESSDKAQAKKKKAGKRSLSVPTGENAGGSTKGLNVV